MGSLYSLFMIDRIWGICFFSVRNGSRCDLFHCLYKRWIDFGSVILVLYMGMPCLAMLIDRIKGAHAALIVDLTGLRTCKPFCDVGRDISSRT